MCTCEIGKDCEEHGVWHRDVDREVLCHCYGKLRCFCSDPLTTCLGCYKCAYCCRCKNGSDR